MTSDSLQIHLNNLKGPLRKVSNLAIMTESKIKDDIYLNGLRIYDIIEDKGWLKVYGYKYWDDLVIEYEELLDLAERKKFDINDKLNIVKAKLSNCHDIMMKLFKRLRNQ